MSNSTPLTIEQDGKILENDLYTQKDLMRICKRIEYSSSIIAIVLISILLFFFMDHFLVYKIPSPSMVSTLHVGEEGIARSYFPGMELQRGDIILFDPITEQNKDLICAAPNDIFIKRIVGLPGEKISITNQQVYINGAPLDEPYAIYATNETSEMNEIIVPEGCYFVMGDNRSHSADSRGDLGCIPLENIKGKSFFHIPSLTCRLLGFDDDNLFVSPF